MEGIPESDAKKHEAEVLGKSNPINIHIQFHHTYNIKQFFQSF